MFDPKQHLEIFEADAGALRDCALVVVLWAFSSQTDSLTVARQPKRELQGGDDQQ